MEQRTRASLLSAFPSAAHNNEGDMSSWGFHEVRPQNLDFRLPPSTFVRKIEQFLDPPGADVVSGSPLFLLVAGEG